MLYKIMMRLLEIRLVAFEKESIENTFGEVPCSKQYDSSFSLAETEKYAHVTFFFNGGVEEPNKGRRAFTW